MALRFLPVEAPVAHIYFKTPRIFSSFSSLITFPKFPNDAINEIGVVSKTKKKKHKKGMDEKFLRRKKEGGRGMNAYLSKRVSPMLYPEFLHVLNGPLISPSSSPRYLLRTNAFGVRESRHRHRGDGREFLRGCWVWRCL